MIHHGWFRLGKMTISVPHPHRLRIQNQRVEEGLRTSGGAALALLAPVLHDHIWVDLPCK
jgi:hypothetical protein